MNGSQNRGKDIRLCIQSATPITSQLQELQVLDFVESCNEIRFRNKRREDNPSQRLARSALAERGNLPSGDISLQPRYLNGVVKQTDSGGFRMRKLFALGLLVLLAAACRGQNDGSAAAGLTGQIEPPQTRQMIDREGFDVTLPDEINRIITIGPSNTEIVVALGLGEKIVAADAFSADVYGLPEGITTELDMLSLDAEYVVSLMPDIIFITGIARAGGTDDPLAPVTAAGITVVYMPSSASLADIAEDILFIAEVLMKFEAGEALVLDMQAEVNEVREIARGITTSRTVYFELYPAPWMVSFGSGTFLHEMIELVGATNIFEDIEGWVSVSDENLILLNPDVILTSSDFLEDPIGEIAGRPGFEAIAAVQNGNIHVITANYSNRPNHNITRALWEIARAVFPEYFD